MKASWNSSTTSSIRHGHVRMRATFANTDGQLVPGLFARVQLAAAGPHAKPALLINERAVGTDQNRKFVFVVDADNKAEYRAVKLGRIRTACAWCASEGRAKSRRQRPAARACAPARRHAADGGHGFDPTAPVAPAKPEEKTPRSPPKRHDFQGINMNIPDFSSTSRSSRRCCRSSSSSPA
jgi:multidrug efflux system membrane fusion protein